MELFRKALDMTKADIYQFIAKQKLGVLGTFSSGGRPQSALVGIAVTPELEIIFDTVKSSRKFQNLMSNRGCSFVIGWTGEITVQYEGQAGQPKGVALARYQQAYFARWPECGSHLSWPASRISWSARGGFATATLIRIRPSLKSSPSTLIFI